jgi:hypothetical protein
MAALPRIAAEFQPRSNPMSQSKFDAFSWLTQKAITVMAGLAVVQLLALLSVPKLDWPLTLALYALAIAIPALAGYLLLSEGMKAAGRKLPESHTIDLAASTGAGLSYAALACIFLHFSFIAAFGFMSVTSLMIVFVVYHLGEASRGATDFDRSSDE